MGSPRRSAFILVLVGYQPIADRLVTVGMIAPPPPRICGRWIPIDECGRPASAMPALALG